VPGGFPRHTYNPRVELQLETRLAEVRDNLCKLATVTGQTKSGKTVLARKILPREDCVWIDGGVVSAENDFWDVVIEQLDLFQGSQKQATDQTSAKLSGKVSAGANFLVAKGSGEIGTEIQNTEGEVATSTRTPVPGSSLFAACLRLVYR